MNLNNKINAILNKYDIEGLIAWGAPNDEYETEAKEIYNDIIITKSWNYKKIHLIMNQVFLSSFSYDVSYQYCTETQNKMRLAAKEIADSITWCDKLVHWYVRLTVLFL